jgi:hypothetical protein
LTTDSAAHLGPADSQRLYDEAMAAHEKAAALGLEGDWLLAQSEIVHVVARAGAELADGQDQLKAANKQLADSLAALEPVAAELAQVNASLAELPAPSDQDDIGSIPVQERIQARVLRQAMQEELAKIQRIADQRQAAVTNAHELIRSVERWVLPDLAAAFDQARAALQVPPLNDLPALLALAPRTMRWRTSRLGTALMIEISSDERQATAPNIATMQAALRQDLASCGALGELAADWKRRLLGKLDPKTRTKVLVALGDIVDPRIIPLDHNQLAAQHRFAAQTIHGNQAVLQNGPQAGQTVPAEPITPGLGPMESAPAEAFQQANARDNRLRLEYERRQQRDSLW